MKVISEIYNKMIENEKVMKDCINLVSSENQLSLFSKFALLSDSYNRYFFNPDVNPYSWNFQGCKNIYNIETDICIPILKRLSHAEYVNIRPLSGLSCMMLVLNALGGDQGSSILTVSPDQGGHYATADLARSFGLQVDFIPGIDGQSFDYNSLEKLLVIKKYHLIYLDQSYCLFPIDLKKVITMVRNISPETIIHVDMSHTMGLVLGQAYENPLDLGADSFGGSTHKTFPGPQRGIFCTNSKELDELVKEHQFFMISHHHFGEVISLAISLLEFETLGGKEYAQQVIKNAKYLAKLLDEYGFDVKHKDKGFTNTHQVWMATQNMNIDTYEVAMKLYNVGIITNVLYDLPQIPEATLRIGINEFTYLGAGKDEIEKLAQLINDTVRSTKGDDAIREEVKILKRSLCSPFQYHYQDNCKIIDDLVKEVLV